MKRQTSVIFIRSPSHRIIPSESEIRDELVTKFEVAHLERDTGTWFRVNCQLFNICWLQTIREGPLDLFEQWQSSRLEANYPVFTKISPEFRRENISVLEHEW